MNPEAPTIEITETVIIKVEGDQTATLMPVDNAEPEQTPEEDTI